MKTHPEKSIFLSAIEIDSATERAAYLDQACAGNPSLRGEMDALLEAHDKPQRVLDRPDACPPTIDETILESPGTAIGPYKLLEQIGEGGFGVVFMAEQHQPIRRKVALKVIKAGMDTRQVIARFEAERQALALMDHPNIAKVLDAGATASGRPYFVMELVRGVPITAYCDEAHLNPRERLELFLHVCEAVQHAHQKGIIHRDIKPSNVLITLHDGKPTVKVIDFGIAKATGQQLTEKTLFTNFAQMVGTPLYMSPEQAGGSADIDTRSDIYGLGVLLYELLTGSTPFDKERLKSAAFDEIRRIIREEDPPRPSTKLSGSATLASVAAMCKTEPKRLSHLFRGEVDWIVMKALEKDRGRRYETANGFAMDIKRYLNDEPVLACPPSAGYRLRKFARRNKGGLGVAALVLFFMVLLGSGAGWAWRDRSAREAEAARQQGERQARAAGQIESIFAEVNRLEGEQKWPEALAAARRAEAVVAGGEADAATAERVRDRLKDLDFIDRLERIRMQWAATQVDGTFDYAGAARDYARAFRDYGVDLQALAVEASIDRLKARRELAIHLAAALDDWVVVQRRVSPEDTANWKRLVAVARGVDPDSLRDLLRSNFGHPASDKKTQDELRRLAESIDVRVQHPATLVSLAISLRGVGHADSALRVLRDARDVYPGDFWLNFHLGNGLDNQKDYEGAVRFFTAAVSIRPKSIGAHINLGNALHGQKKLDEAVAAYRKAMELDPKYAGAHTNLGLVLTDQKKLAEAIAAHCKAIELDPKHTVAHINLGAALYAQWRLDEAVAAYRKAVELDPKNSIAYSNLGSALREQKKPDEAIAAYRKAIELDPKSASGHNGLGDILRLQGKLDEAIAAFRKAVELDPKSAFGHNGLGDILRLQGKLDEAIAAFRKAVEINPENPSAHNSLGNALLDQDKLDEAAAAFRKAVEINPDNALAYCYLGIALRKQKTLAEAIAAFRKAVEIYPGTAASVHAQIKQMSKGKEFDALRDREDFKKLVAEVEAKRPLNDRAWDLATHHDPSLRDPTRAVELAEKAVAEAPSKADYWNTLGVARYRAGDYKGAVTALKKFRELRTNDAEWTNPFFLAMAHWKQGEKDEAVRWYELAVEWMERKKANSEMMRRVRAEAADLLAVEKKKD